MPDAHLTDERDELTPAQQALAAALELNEAMTELLSCAQNPDMLARSIAMYAADPDGEPPHAAALDAIAQAISDLHHMAGRPTCSAALTEAADRWIRGEDD